MFDAAELERLVKQQLNNAIAEYLETMASSDNWLNDLKHMIAASVSRTVTQELKEYQLDKIVGEATRKLFEAEKKAATHGIDDQADRTELTVMNGAVVAENQLVATDLRAIDTIQAPTIIADTIQTDWKPLRNEVLAMVEHGLKDEIIHGVIETAKAGIDFENVTIQGTPLINGDTLSSRIKKTNISTVGTLNQLHVAGEALVHNTAYIGNKRVGINTQEPSMSLDVWDEEVQVSIGKKSERTAFVGSNRLQNLKIGVNGKGNITITDKNVVIIENLQVDKNRISWGTNVPGTSAGKGDIVFNTNVGPANPVFAWMCVGGHNWIALSATIS
jgi:hypothetical protein